MNTGNTEAWLVNRYKNVTTILKKWKDDTSRVAWAVGAGLLLIGYPLAISIIDDRFLAKKGLRHNN